MRTALRRKTQQSAQGREYRKPLPDAGAPADALGDAQEAVGADGLPPLLVLAAPVLPLLPAPAAALSRRPPARRGARLRPAPAAAFAFAAARVGPAVTAALLPLPLLPLCSSPQPPPLTMEHGDTDRPHEPLLLPALLQLALLQRSTPPQQQLPHALSAADAAPSWSHSELQTLPASLPALLATLQLPTERAAVAAPADMDSGEPGHEIGVAAPAAAEEEDAAALAARAAGGGVSERRAAAAAPLPAPPRAALLPMLAAAAAALAVEAVTSSRRGRGRRTTSMSAPRSRRTSPRALTTARSAWMVQCDQPLPRQRVPTALVAMARILPRFRTTATWARSSRSNSAMPLLGLLLLLAL